MANRFGISQVEKHFTQMDLPISKIDRKKGTIELDIHLTSGEVRLKTDVKRHGELGYLLIYAPQYGMVTNKKRTEVLEALLYVNYRIALGKFSLDLQDGEVRFEETFPFAKHGICFEQFRMLIGAMLETLAMYHSLIPRIIYGNLTVQEALHACEEEFVAEMGLADEPATHEINVADVLTEVTRILDEPKE